jgi:hypothetical protein
MTPWFGAYCRRAQTVRRVLAFGNSRIPPMPGGWAATSGRSWAGKEAPPSKAEERFGATVAMGSRLTSRGFGDLHPFPDGGWDGRIDRIE